MTIDEMNEKLKNLGLKKRYKPEWDHETQTILLQTRKPAQVVDGYLVGSEIALIGDVFKVWTARKGKAKSAAKEHGLTVRLLDGEAELLVTADKADALLHGFGAKVKKTISAENLSELRLRGLNLRNRAVEPQKPKLAGLPEPATASSTP